MVKVTYMGERVKMPAPPRVRKLSLMARIAIEVKNKIGIGSKKEKRSLKLGMIYASVVWLVILMVVINASTNAIGALVSVAVGR